MEDLSGFWFGWGHMRMWDPSIKDSKQRELVAASCLVLVSHGGVEYISKMHRS